MSEIKEPPCPECGQPYVPEASRIANGTTGPLTEAIERILDEHSAWIARPNRKVTEAIALAIGATVHRLHYEFLASEPEQEGASEELPEGAQRPTPPPFEPVQAAPGATDIAERIVLRRLRENRIDGYTLEMAREIVEAACADDDLLIVLQELTIRHYGNAAERDDQFQRFGLSHYELEATLESMAKEAIAKAGV